MRRRVHCIRFDGRASDGRELEVPVELPFAIYVNGRYLATVMTYPMDLEDLVTGMLFSERMVRDPQEIESFRVEKSTISVLTRDPFRVAPPGRRIISGCGGVATDLDPGKLPKVASDLTLDGRDLLEMVSCILQEVTGSGLEGFCTAAVADSQRICTMARDFGRLSALDRAIGRSLRTGIDLVHSFAYVSGGIIFESVRRCLIAGIPVLASDALPTTMALEVAERNGLTIASWSDGRLHVWTRSRRIAGI